MGHSHASRRTEPAPRCAARHRLARHLCARLGSRHVHGGHRRHAARTRPVAQPDDGDHRAQGVSCRAGGRPGQPARRADRLAHRVGRRGPAHPLRRPAALRRRAVLRAARHAGRAALGPLRHERGARPRMSVPRASGYFRTRYAQDSTLLETRTQRVTCALFIVFLIAFPFAVKGFALDLANQVLLASVGAVALMLLTGYAGQISLGHAGFLAAGAFTAGILFKELGATIWLTLPASAVVGALLGVVFGLPSLRLRGLYLAVSTLALHFIVIYAGGEYETKRGFSTGVVIDSPFSDARAWYFLLLAAAVGTVLLSLNLLRSRTGRAWRAIHGRETVAGALGISVQRAKLSAFIVSSALTSMAGCLFAYYRGFVSAEAFSLFLTIQYVAMVIIGGMGSILGAVLGAVFVTLFPYGIEALVASVPTPAAWANSLFAVNYAAFGLVMILFLVFEPAGLVGIWRRLQDYFLLWPFRRKPMAASR